MAEKYYPQVEKHIIDTFTKLDPKNTGGIKHFIRTVHWIKVLKPNASEALLIAAIAHDLERSIRNYKTFKSISSSNKGFKSEEYLTYHQDESARLISKYLQKIGADKKMIDQVAILVSKHEVGGNEDQNLLKDADSLSFFENNVDLFITKRVKDVGKEKVKEKFDWTFDRITSKKAKEIARPMYENALKKLKY